MMTKQGQVSQLCGASLPFNDAGTDFLCGRCFRVSNGAVELMPEFIVREVDYSYGSNVVVPVSPESVMSFSDRIAGEGPNNVRRMFGRAVYTNGTMGPEFEGRSPEYNPGAYTFMGQVNVLNNGSVLVSYETLYGLINARLFSPTGSLIRSDFEFMPNGNPFFKNLAGSQTILANGDVLVPFSGVGAYRSGIKAGLFFYRMTEDFVPIRTTWVSDTGVNRISDLNNGSYRMWMASGSTLTATDFDSQDQSIGNHSLYNASTGVGKISYQIVALSDNTTVIGWSEYQYHNFPPDFGGQARGFSVQRLDQTLQKMGNSFQLSYLTSADQWGVQFVRMGKDLGAGYASWLPPHQAKIYLRLIEFLNSTRSPSVSPTHQPSRWPTLSPTVPINSCLSDLGMVQRSVGPNFNVDIVDLFGGKDIASATTYFARLVGSSSLGGCLFFDTRKNVVIGNQCAVGDYDVLVDATRGTNDPDSALVQISAHELPKDDANDAYSLSPAAWLGVAIGGVGIFGIGVVSMHCLAKWKGWYAPPQCILVPTANRVIADEDVHVGAIDRRQEMEGQL